MATITKEKSTRIPIAVTLPQIAESLRGLSRRELETLALLVDRKAMQTIEASAKQAKRGKMREL